MEEKSIKMQREYANKNGWKNYLIDGPINYKEYNQQKFRILFYLKEAYGYEEGEVIIGNVFNDWIDKEKKTNIEETLLSYHILNFYDSKIRINNKEQFYSIKSNSNLLKETSKKIAHINIKKTFGEESKSNDSLIRDESRKNSDLLKQQIQLYKPDLIITGGPVCWDSLIDDLGLFNIDKNSVKRPGIIKYNDIYLCNSYHPEYYTKEITELTSYDIYNLIIENIEI